MTEPKDAPNSPFGGFVVETQMKPDGRLIHYYEWLKDSPEAGPAEADEADDAGPPQPAERDRV